MATYLYGASIKGIHDYITSTNKLKEIVGASKLLKEIEKFIEEFECEALVKAAANIKAVVKSEKEARKIVYKMPKKVMQEAYGVTFVQALVKIDGDKPSKEDFDELERRLGIQRNKPMPPVDMALAVMDRSPRTGRPAIGGEKEKVDLSTKAKLDIKIDGIKDTKQIKNGKNKIAIIHADGNGLGKIIPELLRKSNEKAAEVLKEFSTNLGYATDKAFEKAVKELNLKRYRKLMLSGDDMMVVIDPNVAVEFTKRFLEAFEKETQERLGPLLKRYVGKERLTACAGIIFCNEKYPMHHAVRLAEGLNAKVKKIVKKEYKEDVPSAMAFANVLSGLAVRVEDFVENTICDESGKEVQTFFAPYYLKKEYGPSIGDLLELFDLYESENSPLPKLRNWLTLLGQNYDYAQLVLDRINEIATSKWSQKKRADEILERIGIEPDTMLMKVEEKRDDKGFNTFCKKEEAKKEQLKTIVYDLLTLHSVMDDRSKR